MGFNVSNPGGDDSDCGDKPGRAPSTEPARGSRDKPKKRNNFEEALDEILDDLSLSSDQKDSMDLFDDSDQEQKKKKKKERKKKKN